MASSKQPAPFSGPEPAPADELERYEVDSALADTDSVTGTETTTLASSITRYREELGRTYHSYGSTEHWGPNDEEARDQLDLSHHLWTLALRGKLYLSPIKEDSRILDLGTGTGIWAMDVAENQKFTVKGIDLSPIQPSWVLPNVTFEVDDYNLDWLDEAKYDFIHGRELLGTAPDWVALYKKAFKALKPGGWFEQHEPGISFQTDHNTFDKEHVLHQWGPLMLEAGKKANLDFDVAPAIKDWLQEAGFVNVTEVRQAWPVGKWPKDKHERTVGQWNYTRIDAGILGFCGRRFHSALGWTPEEIDVFCEKVRKELKDNKLLTYHSVYYVYGQKPPEP